MIDDIVRPITIAEGPLFDVDSVKVFAATLVEVWGWAAPEDTLPWTAAAENLNTLQEF